MSERVKYKSVAEYTKFRYRLRSLAWRTSEQRDTVMVTQTPFGSVAIYEVLRKGGGVGYKISGPAGRLLRSGPFDTLEQARFTVEMWYVVTMRRGLVDLDICSPDCPECRGDMDVQTNDMWTCLECGHEEQFNSLNGGFA